MDNPLTGSPQVLDPDGCAQCRSILENLNEGIWRIDAAGKTVHASDRMAAILGYTRSELLGRQIFDFMAERSRSLVASNLERREAAIRERQEFEFIHKDGRRIQTVISTSPLFDGDGSYSGAIATVLDITDSRNMAEQLKRYALAVQTAGHAIYMTDPDGIILTVNPAFEAVTGYAPGEAIGMTPRLLKSGLMDESYYRRLWSTISSGQTWNEEVINRRKDGSIYHALQSIAAFHNEDGSIAGYVAIQSDFTARRSLEQELASIAARDTTILATMREGVVLQGQDGRIISANDAARYLLGLSSHEGDSLTGLDAVWPAIREDGSPYPASEQPTVLALRKGINVDEAVLGLSRSARSTVWLAINARPIRNSRGDIDGVVTTFVDISERKRRSDAIKLAAETDFLTGLRNRYAMDRTIRDAVARARRYGEPLSILFLDIDFFKKVNDTWGHETGDEVLKAVAACIRQSLRETDVAARWGGEEFLIMAAHSSASEARVLAERIRLAIAGMDAGRVGTVTASLGVAQFASGDDIDSLIARADAGLYRAKQGGRNRVELG
jgi:diguanylate cyclase (GGDEF)-like protein/PAS domain S-box-containing protein